jgi:hypothetical protein
MEFNIPIEVYDGWNDIGNQVPMFNFLLDSYDIKLKKLKLNDLIKDNKNFVTFYSISWDELSPPQTAKDLEINLKTILDKIDNSVIRACNEKRCVIIIQSFQIYLGIKNDEVGYQPFFDKLYIELQKKGLKNFDYLYYMTDYLRVKDNTNKINVISYWFMEEFLLHNVLCNRPDNFGLHDAIKPTLVTETEALSHKRKKHFLCYNKFLRGHRKELGTYLYTNKLIDKGLFSFYKVESDKNNKYTKFLESTPYVLDYDYNTEVYDAKEEGLAYNLIKSHYLDTYFNIVTETDYEQIAYTLTEKTLKPILQLQPFIIVGGVGALQYLKECGYQTFPEIINEEYDNIVNNRERYRYLFSEIHRLCNVSLDEWDDMYRRVWDKLIHNRKLFLKRNTQVFDLFEEIHEKI